jgi:catechol 2,3-dioxygenase-like lactoylglutathione lyase family enzyme
MIKRLHSTLFYASNLKATADFYRKLGFDVQESKDDVRIKMGDFTLAFIDDSFVRAHTLKADKIKSLIPTL